MISYFSLLNSQINDQGIEIEHYTNNISERQFRTLKATISHQKVNFGIPQMVKLLTIDTQMFYEGKNLDNVHVTKFIQIGTTPTSSSSSSTPEIECSYLEDEGIFEVDGHKVLAMDLICTCPAFEEAEDDHCEHIQYLLTKFEYDLISFISICFLVTM